MRIHIVDTKKTIFSRTAPIVVTLENGDLGTLMAAPGGAIVGLLAGEGYSDDDRRQALRAAAGACAAEALKDAKIIPEEALPVRAYAPGTPEHMVHAAEAVQAAMMRYAHKSQRPTGKLDTSTHMEILAEIGDLVDMAGFAISGYCVSRSGEIRVVQLKPAVTKRAR